jgi:hypothetical protein
MQSLKSNARTAPPLVALPQLAKPAASLRPGHPVKSPGGVALSMCLGSPLGGCIILAFHYGSLGRATELWVTVALGLLTSAALILVLRPARVQRCGFSWKTVGFGLTAGVFCLSLAAAGVWTLEALAADTCGAKLVFGAGDEVYFSKEATVAEAMQLGQFLQDDGYFDRPTASRVQLAHESDHITISFVVSRDAWNDQQIIASYRSMGEDISESVFAGKPVEVRMCDEELTVRKKLHCMTSHRRRVV